jgi:hypothetical protein
MWNVYKMCNVYGVCMYVECDKCDGIVCDTSAENELNVFYGVRKCPASIGIKETLM